MRFQRFPQNGPKVPVPNSKAAKVRFKRFLTRNGSKGVRRFPTAKLERSPLARFQGFPVARLQGSHLQGSPGSRREMVPKGRFQRLQLARFQMFPAAKFQSFPLKRFQGLRKSNGSNFDNHIQEPWGPRPSNLNPDLGILSGNQHTTGKPQQSRIFHILCVKKVYSKC